MVRPVGHETDKRVSNEDRRDQRHVRQVGTAQVGIVDYQHVARSPLCIPYQSGHGPGHAAKVNRNVGSLRTQLASGIENGAGKVQAILDISRESGALQYRPHLVTGRGDTTGKHAKFNWIH